jgi:excisionase family DNA binding protein
MEISSIQLTDMHKGVKQQLNADASPPNDPLWTVEDVAAYLQLQPETIRSMARRGELPALKIGKVWRFQKQAVHAMIINMD